MITPMEPTTDAEGAQIDFLIPVRLWKADAPAWTGGETYGEFKLRLGDIFEHPAVETWVHEHDRSGNVAWDLGRVRYFYERLMSGLPVDPIDVDNDCSGGHIHATPVILDGDHRLAAAILADKHIPAYYGGRVDLLDYLRGKTNRHP